MRFMAMGLRTVGDKWKMLALSNSSRKAHDTEQERSNTPSDMTLNKCVIFISDA